MSTLKMKDAIKYFSGLLANECNKEVIYSDFAQFLENTARLGNTASPTNNNLQPDDRSLYPLMDKKYDKLNEDFPGKDFAFIARGACIALLDSMPQKSKTEVSGTENNQDPTAEENNNSEEMRNNENGGNVAEQLDKDDSSSAGATKPEAGKLDSQNSQAGSEKSCAVKTKDASTALQGVIKRLKNAPRFEL